MPDQDDAPQEPTEQRSPTSGDEPSSADQLQTPSPGGGPAVTPTGTSEGNADTSVFEGAQDQPEERLQSADEDTFPPT